MTFYHFAATALLALSFSGKPVPKADVLPLAASTTTISSDRASNELIPWTGDRLTWEDFLCEPRKGTDAVASTSTSLGIAYQMQNGKLTYNITCQFSKVKSWGLMKTDYILAHEQGHFDITEIYARKLNEALKNYAFNRKTFKKDIGDIYQSIVKEKEDFQQQYDAETDHSRKRKVQYEWLEKIDGLLKETAPYAAYP